MANRVWSRATGALLAGVMLTLTAAPAFAAVSVNGVQISDNQISQRARLFQLEGKRNNATKGATEELINEALQLQEAKRLNIDVTEAQVEGAFQQVARNTKLSQDKLTAMFQQAGVNIDTLRARLRASIAWSGVTQQAIVPQVQISDLALDQEASAKAGGANGFDYILKEIIFVGGGSNQRSGQANKYRSNFQGCDTAVQLSLSYTDAAVIDVGRRHATQMPEAIAKELAGLNVGGITKPRVVDNGMSMLAVCEKAEARDLTFIKSQLRQEAGNDALKGESETYLAELRKNAKIIYN